MSQFLWKIGGEAGFGIMTTGLTLAKIATRSGYNVFDYPEYPSLIRGGHNTMDVIVSPDPVSATKHVIDLLICLNKVTYTYHKDRLTTESIVVYDPDEFEPDGECIKVPIPFKKIRTEHKVVMVMMNTVALGVSVALMGADLALFDELLIEEFKRKGDEVVEFNKQFAKLGYDEVINNHKQNIKNILTRRSTVTPKMVLTANEAFALGAVIADCRFFSAYPMTPTSAVLTVLAGWSQNTGMIVRHNEDEVAVINTVLGASHAGVRSATATSGGGFALMVEAISFAGVAEIPVVIFLGQRPGPATGMPTWTEQGDLLFAVHAGHGEFPKIVLAAGDVFEMIELTAKAFDLADIYQVPVIIMGDKLINESHMSIDAQAVRSFIATYTPDRGKMITDVTSTPYLRYAVTDDGISPRLIPGGPTDEYFQANSYEHEEDSHTTEEAEPRIEQVDKRARKMSTYLKNHFSVPTVYGDLGTATTVLVSWGSNKGAIRMAQAELQANGINVAYIHFTHLFPLDIEKVSAMFKQNKRYLLIENNSEGQFGKLLRTETGIDIKDSLLKYDGRPFYVEELVSSITQFVQNSD